MIEVFDMGKFDWYTIETLQKLCYYKETATTAIKLLFKIANKESELTQRAYNTFNDVFQSKLGDTCLNLGERLQILEDIEKESGMNKLIISAYQRALKGYGFTGNIYSGDIDYIKKQFIPSEEDQLSYFKRAIAKLKLVTIENDNEKSELAKEALIFRLVDQVIYGDFEGVMGFVEEVSEKENNLVQEIRSKLQELTSKRFNLEEEKVQRINEILEKYCPKTVQEELETIVINAPWVSEKNEIEQYINISGEKAKELARKYHDNKNQDWLKHLDILLKGEQKQTFIFAEELARLYTEEFIKLQLIRIVSVLSRMKKENQNGIFLNGIISGCNKDEITRSTIDILLKKESTSFFSLLATRYIKALEYSDLEKIKPELKKGDRQLFNIEYLDYSSLANDEFIEFVNWVKNYNPSFALQLIWELLRKEDRWNNLKDLVNDLLYKDNVLDYKSSINSRLHVENLILSSLEDNPTTEKISFVTERILEKYQDFSFNDEVFLNNLLYTLLDKYWIITWSIVGEFMLDTRKISFGLRTFLDSITFDNKQLYEWGHKDQKYAPIAIKYMNVFNENDDESLVWDVYAKRLIDEQGNTNKFLENLDSKFINYSINTVSAEKLYKKRKNLLVDLSDHKFKEVTEFSLKMKLKLERMIEEEKKQRENYE